MHEGGSLRRHSHPVPPSSPLNNSNGTTLALKYINNKSVKILPGEGGANSILSIHSSLDADVANTATFNVALESAQAARGLEGGVSQAARAMLLRLEDALSEASAEACMPTVLVYDVSGASGRRNKLSAALKKLNCAATFVESWEGAIEALQGGGQGGAGTAEYAAFLCDIKPEGGWSRIEAGGERGTSGWDVCRTLREMAGDDAGAGDAEGGGKGGGAGAGGWGGVSATKAGKSSVFRRCKTGVPVVGIGVMNGDETARDPRAATVPVSSVICHCEEAGMLAYVQKPITAPKLRTALAGFVPGIHRDAGEDADEDAEEEEHLDEALEEWGASGGWISKLAMVPFRISRFALKRCRSYLPVWMVHILGNAFGVHFKNK